MNIEQLEGNVQISVTTVQDGKLYDHRQVIAVSRIQNAPAVVGYMAQDCWHEVAKKMDWIPARAERERYQDLLRRVRDEAAIGNPFWEQLQAYLEAHPPGSR